MGCENKKTENFIENTSGLKIKIEKVISSEEKWHEFGGDGYSKKLLNVSAESLNEYKSTFSIIKKSQDIPLELKKYENGQAIFYRKINRESESIEIFYIEKSNLLYYIYSKI